jgi:hypothetical protein
VVSVSVSFRFVIYPKQAAPEESHPQVEAGAGYPHTTKFSQHGHGRVHGPEHASNSLDVRAEDR